MSFNTQHPLTFNTLSGVLSAGCLVDSTIQHQHPARFIARVCCVELLNPTVDPTRKEQSRK